MPLLRRQPGAREIADFKDWARAHAIHLTTPLDSDANAHLLDAINPSLDRKRIVFLGEPDHFVHEKYDYRLLMLRHLVSRGWNLVGEEMGVSDGYRVDRFFATGDGSWLERVPIYGYKGARRTDRIDQPTGLLKDSYSAPFPEAEFGAEQKSFARRLRDLAATHLGPPNRLHFFGFDIDGAPGAGYEDIAALLELMRSHDSVEDIIRRLARVPNESVADEIACLDDAIGLLFSAHALLADLLESGRADLVTRFACALRDSLRYTQIAFPAADWTTLNRAMALRETLMHRQVDDALDPSLGARKVALMSHNLHLAKDYPAIKGNFGAGPGGGLVDSLGAHLAKRTPDDIYSVWMLCNRGRDSQPFSFCTSEIKPVTGSLNSTLLDIGGAFILPLDRDLDDRAARLLFNPDLTIAMDGNTQVRTAIALQADAICFVDEVSPLRA